MVRALASLVEGGLGIGVGALGRIAEPSGWRNYFPGLLPLSD